VTVPYIFDPDEILSLFIFGELEATAENIEEAALRLGRNWYPALVSGVSQAGWLSAETARIVVPAAWSSAEFPMLQLEPDEWRELFDLAGYTIECVATARPTESLTLWRGALSEHRNGWSWTDDRDLAQWFADRPHNAGRGQVWAAAVDPCRLLARISEQRPGESEHVIDARGLAVALADSLRTRGA
jgi:hypothetical protein